MTIVPGSRANGNESGRNESRLSGFPNRRNNRRNQGVAPTSDEHWLRSCWWRGGRAGCWFNLSIMRPLTL